MTGQDEKAPDEIDLLLPWHAVERLSPAEAERVAAALRADPERVRHLDIAREEHVETVALNQSLGLPSRGARDALFSRIAAEGRKPAETFAQRWRGWLAALSPRALAVSGVAAALVIAVQAGFLAKVYLSEQGSGYETASAPVAAPGSDGAYALVAFAPGATAARIEALLRETRSRIVDGPRPGGLYRLRLGDGATTPTAAAALIDRLKAETEVVRLAAPEAPATR
ncbi:hypothetical protein [Methylobacterium haplocladii]|uniref:Uncharacterized protein n=1 Tax=Methylobacterium haplocladii TaxID=1176176 RepID=A0A512IM03_9HYPH|nr:hypothetical protein [Methylobacterium haplocladii]GEO98662.1 hypothetical protein MHA02_10500 [Methylobacterium haplocladii]GJD83937.1 hypothetical protein HPGCJGGD_1811 [Methylobacterium haplocladii]GLS57688.1 hypothetical protein GCM10007887_03440 [Methylobacterium haplocladii]